MVVGAGSFAYHGPQPSWAEVAHDWPIVAVAAVYAAGLARSGRAAAVVGLGDTGRGLRAGTGRLRRGTLRVAAVPARQPVAVPRRLARPLCRCRRMGRPGHGAGPAGERQPARIAAAAGRSVGPVEHSPADGVFIEALGVGRLSSDQVIGRDESLHDGQAGRSIPKATIRSPAVVPTPPFGSRHRDELTSNHPMVQRISRMRSFCLLIDYLCQGVWVFHCPATYFDSLNKPDTG